MLINLNLHIDCIFLIALFKPFASQGSLFPYGLQRVGPSYWFPASVCRTL